MPRTVTQSPAKAIKPLRPIRTAADHRAALKELSAFFDNEPEPRTPEGDRFEILLTLVEAYEAKHFPIDLPDPVEAIKFRMEQSGLTPKDLQPMIGRMNRVYEVLNRKRPLTLPMIWRLHQGLGIPAENLIRPSQAMNSLSQ
jgi:HTH-type transcriptional regulator / antitoxin HigA